jgi:hypothetical protein
MAKIIKMDRDIDLGVAAYMNNMLLVGDPSASGISTIYANKYIKETQPSDLSFIQLHRSVFRKFCQPDQQCYNSRS